MKDPLVVWIRRETKPNEGRMFTPEMISQLRGTVSPDRKIGFVVESGYGQRLGLEDAHWMHEAIVLPTPEIYDWPNFIQLGVKEPTPEEAARLQSGQGCLCFQHTATNKEVVQELLGKGVKVLPLEYHRPALVAMSREAGRRIPEIIERCFGPIQKLFGNSWKKENIFVLGARGVFGRNAIDMFLHCGVSLQQIHACDLEEMLFTAVDTENKPTYRVFSIRNENEVMASLQVCRIVIFVAKGPQGAPQDITRKHLGVMPHNSLIIQGAIDEGGNIEDPLFGMQTTWDEPVYQVEFEGAPKRWHVCNMANIPGCIRPEESSEALFKASFDYLCRIFIDWPNIPEEYLFK